MACKAPMLKKLRDCFVFTQIVGEIAINRREQHVSSVILKGVLLGGNRVLLN